MWQTVLAAVGDLDEPARDYTTPIYFGRAVEDAAKVRAVVPTLRASLSNLDATLRDRTWLVGNAISAADICAYPVVKSLERAAGKPGAEAFGLGFVPVTDRYRAIGRWMGRIEALPGYDRTYPPHWR